MGAQYLDFEKSKSHWLLMIGDAKVLMMPCNREMLLHVQSASTAVFQLIRRPQVRLDQRFSMFRMVQVHMHGALTELTSADWDGLPL